MKKAINTLFVLSIILLSFTSCDKESVVAVDALPTKARTYVTTHFPINEIIQVVKDREGLSVAWEVYLNGGYKLDFDRSGDIEGIEGTSKLPDSVIPAPILAYVRTNYPEYDIIDWEYDDNRRQDVKLNNGVELEFDSAGNFLRLDF